MSEDNDVEKFKGFLKELFRIDLLDLDFGIYRIMKAKQEMITEFIDRELVPIVDSAINEIPSDDNLKNEVFNLSYEFFSRYYSDGDFIPQIRYGGKDKYMIPYNGQEIELYWATRNAYYVKTTEYFTNYSFTISDPFDPDKKYKVNFKIKEAALERNYVVSEKKYFLLSDEPVQTHDGEVDIFFNYRPLTEDESKKFEGNEKTVKDALKQKAEETILKEVPKELAEILSRRSQEKDIERSALRRHLDIYTKKNESDYFIIKNLREFLNSELNNFIKNEVLTIDNDFKVSQSNRHLAKAISVLCQKIIEQISQIEDFERRLWEKRKFAYNVNYVITLDKIANKKDGIGAIKKILNDDGMNNQIKEWNELGIVDNNFDTRMIIQNGLTGVTLNEKFKFLPIDTKYFKDLELHIISLFDDLDNELDGWLIHSENYQALNTILLKFKEKVQTIYIDPPYNTGNDDFLYKDKFQHSSWLTMIENRLFLAYKTLSQKGVIFTSIDDNEQANMKILMDKIFGSKNFEAFIWKKKGGASNTEKVIGKLTEYILCYFKNKERGAGFNYRTLDREYKYSDEHGPYNLESLEKTNLGGYKRKTMIFPIIDPKTQKVFYPREGKRWVIGQKSLNELIDKNAIKFDYEKNRVYLIKRPKDYEDAENLFYNLFEDMGSLSIAKNEIANFGFEREQFNTPKPVDLIKHILEISSNRDSLVLDFFTGSGTTAQAVMKLNKEDKGNRKFILIEMADYFNTIIIPRIKKIAYTFNWKNGNSLDNDGISTFFKYYDLEQYEDSLNNTVILEQQVDNRVKPHLIEYILERGLTDSTISINKEMLADPFNIKMRIIAGGVEQEVNIDSVETFNLWYGIDVEKILSTNHDGTQYIFVKGKKERQKIIMIWRSTKGLDFAAEKEFLTETLKKEFKIDDPNEEYSQVLVNSDSALDLSDFGVDVRSLDPIFFRLQWEG